MKALILNSGLGSRMGRLTSEHPKCMTEISMHETILFRQLKQIVGAGIEEVVLTTGYYDRVLVRYCQSLDLPIHFTFVNNPEYDQTNYIYSIYCAKDYLDDDIILIHGDLVFENEVFIYIKIFDKLLGWDIDNKYIKPIADALILSNVIQDDNMTKMCYAAKGEYSENPHTEIYVFEADKVNHFLENYSMSK